jgi:hypothetical protein
MHHRIMARKERESKNEIAGFRGLKPPIPAISNAAKSEKQTPAQSLRALFTDDYASPEPPPIKRAELQSVAMLQPPQGCDHFVPIERLD